MQNFMLAEASLSWFNGLRLEVKRVLARKNVAAFNSISGDLSKVLKDIFTVDIFKVEIKFKNKI